MKRTKVVFISHFDILRARTNQISDIRFCEGFSENGCEVEMVVPYIYRSDNLKKKNLSSVYGLENELTIRILWTPFRKELNKLRFLLFSFVMWLFVCIRLPFLLLFYRKVLVLSRNPSLILPFVWMKRIVRLRKLNVFFWSHDFKTSFQYKQVYRYADKVIATNSSILSSVEKLTGRSFSRRQITSNPISTSQAAYYPNKTDLRRKLGIELNKPLIVYTGKLYKGQKEVAYLLEAARNLPEYHFLITGGKPEVVAFYTENYAQLRNVSFTGFIPDYTQIIDYQYCADVLVSYYTTQDHQTDYNLPQKIVEYMLTGNAIVTPDFKATQDVLKEDTCWFVKEENVNALVTGISEAVKNEDERLIRGSKARELALTYTFKHSTALVLSLI